jgi:PAS domain S-box-containing protein
MLENGEPVPKERGELFKHLRGIAHRLIAKALPRLPSEDTAANALRYLRTRPWWIFGVAIFAVMTALLIRESFPAPFETRLIYVTFYPGVAMATLVGGRASGILATVLAVLVISLWVAPPLDAAAWLGLVTFLLGSFLVVGITEAMHRARARAWKAEDQVRLTEELRKSEEQFRTLVEQASDGIFVSGAQGRYLDVNSAGCRMLGYSREEILRLGIAELIAVDELPRLAPHVAKLRSGETDISEWRFRRKDGSLFVGEVSARQLPDGRLQAFLRDISERKRTEKRQLELMEALKQSESKARQQHALFRGIFEGAPEGIALTDRQRRVVMINPAFTRIFGYAASELIGSSTSKLYADREDWENQATILEDASQSALQPRIIRCRRKNGELFPAAVVRVPYGNGGGQPLGYLGIVRDFTGEQKREEELRQAQRLEALGQLTGGIAHDFNNLLAVISGNLQLIEMRLKDEQLRRYLSEAERAAEMGAHLNQRLMTFGRRRTLAPLVSNLNEPVTHILELIRRTIGEHITVTIALAKDLWPALIDASEIENAILNLAINARDAMPNGGSLVIETKNVVIDKDGAREELPPGSYVRLSVSDTGSGMSPEILARAFEPFFTTKEPGKGTGLGLASVYGFVKQSGGHITLYSEVGRGTTANIYLPKLDQSERTNLAVQKHEAETPIKGAGETVLVVEDNPDVRRVTIERLKSLGYRVLEAESGLSAIAALDRDAVVDLVFSDVIMPGGMSGFELARKVRELRPSQRILLTSGFAGEVARASEDAIHGLLILRKPYSQIELSRLIRAALQD